MNTEDLLDLIINDIIYDSFYEIFPNWMPKSWEGSDFDGREARRDVCAAVIYGKEQNFYRILMYNLRVFSNKS